MKKAKRLLKIMFLGLVIFTAIFFVASICFYQITTKGIALNEYNLQENYSSLQIYDLNNELIKPTKTSYIKLSKLSQNTKNAFICAEDKRFYKHNGLDYVRICGALISNIKTKSFSQGASTISQQLVKNTQLSNKKTISRKLKEFKLTKELEKKYTKDKILELYLNNIYFGNGCYGIENAANHYFSKSAETLTLAESALLAGVINAPNYYDIESKQENALARRNLILSLMKKYNKITNEEYTLAENEKINLKLRDISANTNLYNKIISEACSILKINENEINNGNYKIFTSTDKNLINTISSINKKYSSENYSIANIVIENKTHRIKSICDPKNLTTKKWQPGSTIKPILVFAPAIEKGTINQNTKILDDKINISGYEPKNADKKFHGFISAKTALSNSYNIPAVKILNEVGIEDSKTVAEKFGIEFEKNDNHLALALGGFEKGVYPSALCDAYSVFANKGRFQKSSTITKIIKNGKIIYREKNNEKQIIKYTTANEINEMLIDCAKNGTAKRLSSFDFDIASKTGTVGKNNSTKNQLAYNIAYTDDNTILTMIYGENLNENINGSTYPTMINKEILQNLYKTNYDKQLSKNKNITNENNQNTDDLNYTISATNLPGTKPIICFTLNKKCDIFLLRKHKNKEEIIFSSLQNTQKNINFIDKTAKSSEIYEYKFKICDKLKNEEFYTDTIKLKTY